MTDNNATIVVDVQPGYDLLNTAKQNMDDKDYRSSKTIYRGLVSELRQDLEAIIYRNLQNGFKHEYRLVHDYEWLLDNLNEDGSINKTDENRYRFWCLFYHYRLNRRMYDRERVAILRREPLRIN